MSGARAVHHVDFTMGFTALVRLANNGMRVRLVLLRRFTTREKRNSQENDKRRCREPHLAMSILQWVDHTRRLHCGG